MRYALTTLRHALFAAVRFNRDAARHVATKTIHAAFMVVSVEVGGIFALRRPENDAARRVATSSEKRKNQI